MESDDLVPKRLKLDTEYPAYDSSIRVRAGIVTRQFLLGPPESLKVRLSTIRAGTKDYLGDAANTFVSNLESAVTTACLPFTFAYGTARQLRYQAIQSAERIRQLHAEYSHLDDATREANAAAKAYEQFKAEMAKKEVRNAIVEATIAFLHAYSKFEEMTETAQELLRQVLVMVWGAFEVLVGDVVRAAVNRDPLLAETLLSADKTKRYFSNRAVTVQALAKHQFNVARTMGDVIFADIHFDGLPMIRDVLGALFDESKDLHRQLADNTLWLLWQRRHLIVHKRGVIDAAYLARTSDNPPIGSKLIVDSSCIEEGMLLVSDIALGLLVSKNVSD
jgi:hypothetical protein